MGTSGAVTSLVSGGNNRVASIKKTGVVDGLTYKGQRVPDSVQQAARIRDMVMGANKGTNLSITITNNHNTDDQNFLILDPCGIAAAAGAAANGADIVIKSSFAGLNSAAGYACLKEMLKGSHMGVLGTTFEFSSEGMITTSGIKIYNGTIEDYNSKTLQNYLQLARDNYANDQKILNLSTELYLNNFFAIAGSLPAGGQLTLLFNVPVVSNW